MNAVMAFDYDGLIVDTESTSFLAWREVFARHGAQLKLDDWLSAVGSLQAFDPRVELEKSTGRSLPDLYELKYALHLELDVGQPLLPGVTTLFEYARRRGARIGVVSNSPRWWIETGLKRRAALGYIDHIVSKEDISQHKPNPQGYLKLLTDLSGDSRRAVAFEDSVPGVLAARAASLRVVAVPNPITSRCDFSVADVVVASLEELSLQWLDSIIGES